MCLFADKYPCFILWENENHVAQGILSQLLGNLKLILWRVVMMSPA